MQRVQQMLDIARTQEPSEPVAAILQALQLVVDGQRELLADSLERDEALLAEQQRAERAEQEVRQLRNRLRLLEEAQAAGATEADGESSAASQLAAMREQLDAARARLASLETCLQQNGISPSSGQQLQQALERGADAFMQLATLDQQQKQLREDLAAVKQQLQQQQAGQAAADPRGEIAAWAPADMHPDAIAAALAHAAGISSGSILGVQRRFVPSHRGGAPAAGGGGSAGGADGSDQGAGSSAQGAGGSGGGSSGGAGAGSGEGRGRAPMALYSILLVSQRFEGTVLGGRTRKRLAHERVPVWVEQQLSAEERQARKRMVPLARQLRADGQRTRWRGAALERLVQRGSGRGRWERVPPPPAAGRDGDGAAAAAGTSGSGGAA
jgi:hypothetical protein